MVSLDQEQLDKLDKNDIVKLCLKLQNERDEALTKLHTEIHNINQRFDKLESSLLVSKNVNDKLQDRIISLERGLHATEQYSRRECVEITGIPASVSDDELQSTVCKILKKINVSCGTNDIEACHRLGKKNTTIIKFSSRRKSEKCFEV